MTEVAKNKSIGQKLLGFIKPPYWRIDIVWFTFWSTIAWGITVVWLAAVYLIGIFCPHASALIKLILKENYNKLTRP